MQLQTVSSGVYAICKPALLPNGTGRARFGTIGRLNVRTTGLHGLGSKVVLGGTALKTEENPGPATFSRPA